MPNSKLENKIYNVPKQHQQFLGDKISYENLKMTKTRLTKLKKDGNLDKFNEKGGENILKWVSETLKKERDTIYNVKETGRKAGRENQFLEKHEKNKNANPTAVGGLPKLNKGNVSKMIMSNKVVYNESINKEINKIKYLMEYMNNNKKQNL